MKNLAMIVALVGFGAVYAVTVNGDALTAESAKAALDGARWVGRTAADGFAFCVAFLVAFEVGAWWEKTRP